MNESKEIAYSFGRFCLDAHEKTLHCGEEILLLPPKILDVLYLLVAGKGKIISKSEIMDTVWADSFVEDSSLTQSIYTLRRVLGKNQDGKDYIETVPRRGYRFAVPVLTNYQEEPDKNLITATTVKSLTAENLNGHQINHTPPPAAVANQFLSETLKDANESEKTSKSFASPAGFVSASVFKLTIAFAAFLIVGLLAVYFYTVRNVSPPAPVEKVSFQRLTFSGDSLFPIIAPDGKSFASVRSNSIYLQDVENGSNFKLNISGHQVFGNLQFSVDGEFIYFRNETTFDAAGSLFRVSRFGGTAQVVAQNVWSTPGFSPDGKSMAFIRFYPAEGEWALIIKNMDDDLERKILSRYLPLTIYRTGFPAWSFDGQKIAIIEQTYNQKISSRLLIVNAWTGEANVLETPNLVQIEQIAWEPNDLGLAVVGREDNKFFQIWKVSYPQGAMQKITNELSSFRTISLSSDGKRLLARIQTTYSHLWTASADDLENQKQLTFGNLNRDGWSGDLSFTKDAQTLIYATRITGNTDLWSVQMTGGERRQLTENAGAANEYQVLSPDEKYIYFTSTRTGTRHIWRIDRDGKNPMPITSGENEIDSYPEISPDGHWLYYIKKVSKSAVIIRQSLIDNKIEQLTEAGGELSPESFVTLSPDGKFLAFNNFIEKGREQSGGKNLRIAIIAVEEKSSPKFLNVAANVPRIVWTLDGTAFDYIENSPEAAKIWRQSLDGTSKPQLLLNIPKTRFYDFTWSPDRKTLAVARGLQQSDVILLKNFE